MAFDPSTATEFNPVNAKPVATGETGFDPSSAKAFDPTSAKAAKEDKGFLSELGKGLGEISFEDWKKNSMIAPILEYTARSALGGIMPGLEPISEAEQKQVRRSASDTINAFKEGVANPIETGKAIAKKASDNPGAFTADLIKGLVYDPEMLATGAVGRIAPLVKDASTAAKIGRTAVNTANTATQFGVLAAGAEGAKAKLEGRDVNPQDLMQAASESVYTAVAFEAMHNAVAGAKRGFTPSEAKPVEPGAAPLQPKGPAETLFRTPEEKNLVTGKADAIRDEIEKIQQKYAGSDKPLTKTDAARLKTLDAQMAKDPRLVQAMQERIEQKKAFTEAEPTVVTEKQIPIEDIKPNWDSTGWNKSDLDYVQKFVTADKGNTIVGQTTVDKLGKAEDLGNGLKAVKGKNTVEIYAPYTAENFPQHFEYKEFMHPDYRQRKEFPGEMVRVGFFRGDKKAGVDHVVVSPEFRNKGLGTYLLKTAEKDLGIDVFKAEKFSEAGAGLVNKYRKKLLSEKPKTEPAFYEIYPGQSRESVLAAAKEDKLAMLEENAPPADKAIVDKSLSQLEEMKREGSYAQQAEESVRRRINDIQAKERFIHNDTVKLVKDIPDPVARERISDAIDTGNMSGLSAAEKTAADFLKTKFKDIGERAKKLGIVKELRDNYITHIVDWEKSGIKNIQDAVTAFIETGGTGRESLSGKSRFGKERKYETFEDLNKALQDSGLELRTKDAAEIYQQYARSMERAIENRELINGLKALTDVEGYPLMQRITEKEPIPRSWTTINAPQMQGYAIHPEIAPALKFVFENSEPSKVMKGLNAVSQITKRLQVMGSLFHAKSLLEAKLFTGFVPLAQDIVTGFKGTRDAIDMFKKGGVGDQVDFLIKNGLKVEMPEDVSRGILSDIGKVGDSLMGKLGPIKGKNLEKAGAGVEKYTLGLADKVTWDFMHTGFKLQVAMRELERMKRNYPDANPAELAREVSSYVNNSFGGLNWFDVATRSTSKIGKELAMWAYNNQNRRALQLVLFAPDWTISTLRALKTAFGEGTGLKGLVKPRTEADLARLYQLRAALVYGTILNGLNNITAGRNIWDNKDPTRLEFRDGTSMQLAKHSMEPVHWIKEPIKTLTNKLGFIPQITAPLIFGKEYLQPGAPDLLDQSLTGKLAAAGKKALPFQIQSIASAPEGEGVKRAIAGTLGFPVYGGTPEQKAKQRVERKKAEMEKRIKFIKEEAERAKKTRPE